MHLKRNRKKHQKPQAEIISESWAKAIHNESEVHGNSETKKKVAV